MRLVTALVFGLAACAPAERSAGVGLDDPAEEKGYGPDCAEKYTASEVAASSVITIDWSGLAEAPSMVRFLVLDGDSESVAKAICSESLTQSEILDYASYSPSEDSEPVTSASIDLSGFVGKSLYVNASDDVGRNTAYAFYSISGGATSVIGVLE